MTGMRIRVIAGALLSSLLLAGVALAGSPKAGQLYTSKHLTVTVAKPAKSVKLFVECLPKSGHGAQWTGKVSLTGGSFRIDQKETLSRLPSGKEKGTVDITGKFTGGDFKGTWQLGGTPCGKTSYKATSGGGGTRY
jgi:hypothetical protein